MATSVIIRDLGGYAAPPAPLAQRESNSFNSSGEYYMVMSSGEQDRKSAAVKAPTLEEKLVSWQSAGPHVRCFPIFRMALMVELL